MRHALTTRFVVVLAVVLLGAAVLFAVASNVEPADPVDPEDAGVGAARVPLDRAHDSGEGIQPLTPIA